ncbi:MAG: TIGR00725 family protein [Candidatus Neomarinimicrobiota bacterium]
MKAAQIRIGVYGGSKCTSEISKMAREVGRLLSRKGVLVYCGGLGGVMEAVSEGVAEENGTVVGILPTAHCETANRYITIPVATGVAEARNVIIANSIQGAIAIDGEYGTLSEIAHTLRQKKPVVGLHTWDTKGIEAADSPAEAVSRILELV